MRSPRSGIGPRAIRRNRRVFMGVLGACLLAGLVGPRALEAAEPFMIVALPDTQNYSESYPATFTAQTQWVVDNAATDNIKFVSHLGDIVQTWSNQTQWNRAKTSMSILDANDIPYGTAMGNHDGCSSHPTNYLNNFGPQFYQDETWYGGASPSGLSNYQTIAAGGKEFLFLHVQIDTPPDELTWAQAVLDQNRDKLVVFSTHRYLKDYRLLDGRYTLEDYGIFDDYYEPDGVLAEDLFQDFIRTNKNIFMVLCGHCAGQYHQVSQNNWGLPVYEILQDFDSYTPNGGDGWMRLLTFDTDANEVQVDMYSPTLGRFRVDGPKETHEDFQAALLWLDDPEIRDLIETYVHEYDPNIDVDAVIAWLKENDGQNFWNMAYAAGQRDSSFTLNVDFDAYVDCSLTLSYNKPAGRVLLEPNPNDPNLLQYARGTVVTLTADPNDGKSFQKWKIWDPNFPNDANYAVIDTNNPITVVMDANRKVKVFFKCAGGGMAPFLPMTLGLLMVWVLLRRPT